MPLLPIIFFLLLLLSTIYHPLPVHAVGYGLSVYPPLLRVNIKPGKAITQVFKIDNLTGDDKFFVARLVPFSEADLLGNPNIDLRSTAPWLSYFTLANTNIKLGEPFTIKGNSSEQMILNLSVPENAPVRDIYATLLISTYANVAGIAYQGSLVSATTGSNLLITIASEAFPATLLHVENIIPISGTILKIGNYIFLDNLTPVSFSAVVSNTGSFMAETKGIFRISDRRDQAVHLEGILPVNVISKTKRALLNSDGKNFSFSPNLSHLGVYKVAIAIKTENANAENSLRIIFFPFKAIAGLFFISAFMIIIFRTIYRPKRNVDMND